MHVYRVTPDLSSKCITFNIYNKLKPLHFEMGTELHTTVPLIYKVNAVADWVQRLFVVIGSTHLLPNTTCYSRHL